MNTRGTYMAIIGLLASVSLSAQSTGRKVAHQQMICYAYSNTLEFSPKWVLTSEMHEWRFRRPDEQQQFHLNSHLHYALGENWNASVGFSYFLRSPYAHTTTERLTVPELRPHLQFDYRQPLNRFSIGHRYRFERRFFRNTADGKLVAGYTSSYRFRYRLGVEYHLASIRQLPLKLKVSDEIYINAGDRITYNWFDQNRLSTGVNYAVLKNLTLEVGYLKWFQQRPAGDQFYDRNAISVSVNHKIALKRKPKSEPEEVM